MCPGTALMASVTGSPPARGTFWMAPEIGLVQYACVASTASWPALPGTEASVTRHAPASHAAVDGGVVEHTAPQEPQLSTSTEVSVHAPSQRESPGPQRPLPPPPSSSARW